MASPDGDHQADAWLHNFGHKEVAAKRDLISPRLTSSGNTGVMIVCM